ncbi:hypothetical protein [Marinicellulosiphila megalodicopiae]|uniref:hypothetical protein n=1 Tax=Marinicellulosiphila megalodicopiae TaxID=2724896 RepID=UPI003BB1A964
MSKFQISGTILNGQLPYQELLKLAKALNCKLTQTSDGYLIKNKQLEIVIDLPIIQGKLMEIEEVAIILQDSLKKYDCLYNIEVYELNGRPIDRWQG